MVLSGIMSASMGIPAPTLAAFSSAEHLAAGDGQADVLTVDDRLISTTRFRIGAAIRSLDDTRLLATLSLGPNSQQKAIATVSRIFDQADACRMRLDMMIGFNNGAALPKLRASLEDIHGANIIDLFTSPENAGEDGEDELHDSPRSNAQRYLIGDARSGMHRIFCVHQEGHPHAAGKNAMLKAISDGAIASMRDGDWKNPPSLVLDLDDDAHLFTNDNPDGNGLARLMEERRLRQVSAIGARMRTVPFFGRDDVSVPDLSASDDERYAFLDRAQREWSAFLPGCASLGDMPMFLATRAVIGSRYPGSITDDIHRTVYIRRSGIPWGIATTALSTNEQRGEDDAQLRRWISGVVGLRQTFGDLPGVGSEWETHMLPRRLKAIVRSVLAEGRVAPMTQHFSW